MKIKTLIASLIVGAFAACAHAQYGPDGNYDSPLYFPSVGHMVVGPGADITIAGGSMTVTSIPISTVTINVLPSFTAGISVSTAATASEGICIVGSVTTLPITGYGRGCIAYLTSDPTHIYISTETITSAQSWLAK